MLVAIGLTGGIAVGTQGPIAGAMGQRVGGASSSLIVHLGGAVASLALLLSRGEDLERMRYVINRFGPFVLVLTRAIPVLAEAAVLACGLHRIGWGKFLPPVLLSNLGIAIAYAALGRLSAAQGWFPVAMAVAVALPAVVMIGVGRRWRGR